MLKARIQAEATMAFDLEAFVGLRRFVYHLSDSANVSRLRRLRCIQSAAELLRLAGQGHLTGGRFLRVQVKSTNFRKSKFYVCSMVRFGQKCYTSDDIDYFAIYVIPVDCWYIVPIRAARQTTKTIALSPHNSLSKHAVYKEAWDLLRGQ
jgi:PD-(D/E)XK endonuclease